MENGLMGNGVLVSINRSNGGLPKWPVTGPVMLASDGVAGDRQRNLRVHGGPNKAVLMIAAEVIDRLTPRGFPIFPGALGENLTVSGSGPALVAHGAAVPGGRRRGDRTHDAPPALREFAGVRFSFRFADWTRALRCAVQGRGHDFPALGTWRVLCPGCAWGAVDCGGSGHTGFGFGLVTNKPEIGS